MDYKLSDLEEWDEKICAIAKKNNLDWFDIEYEFIDFYSMIGAMAFHGLPSHFNHWSYGKSFERTHHFYNVGMEGLPYELIINSNPSLAYMMRENPLYLQVLIMAHCVGHSDFFKNNRTFKGTRPESIIGRSRAAKKRFQSYVEDPSIGIDNVEEVIDACHAVQFQIQRPGWIRRTREEIIEAHRDKLKEDPKLPDLNLNKVPLENDYDILGFIVEVPQRRKIFIPITRVTSIDDGGVFITGALNIRRYQQRHGEIQLLAELLDHTTRLHENGESVIIEDIGMELSETKDWYARQLHVLKKARGFRDRKSTRLNSSHVSESRMPSSA